MVLMIPASPLTTSSASRPAPGVQRPGTLVRRMMEAKRLGQAFKLAIGLAGQILLQDIGRQRVPGHPIEFPLALDAGSRRHVPINISIHRFALHQFEQAGIESQYLIFIEPQKRLVGRARGQQPSPRIVLSAMDVCRAGVYAAYTRRLRSSRFLP